MSCNVRLVFVEVTIVGFYLLHMLEMIVVVLHMDKGGVKQPKSDTISLVTYM